MTEREICEKLGISREQLLEVRRMFMEHEHWSKIPSKRQKKYWDVEWTEAGLAKLMAQFGFDEKEAEAIKEEPVFKSEGKVVGKYGNPRLILCEVGDKKVPVLVRDSDFFNVGMTVPLRRDGERLVAARHPRFPGRW
jgi:hypothetical protein